MLLMTIRGRGGRCTVRAGPCPSQRPSPAASLSAGDESSPRHAPAPVPQSGAPWGPQAKPRLLTLPGGSGGSEGKPPRERCPHSPRVPVEVGGAGEVGGWEVAGRRGGVSLAAVRRGAAAVAALLSPAATCPSFLSSPLLLFPPVRAGLSCRSLS